MKLMEISKEEFNGLYMIEKLNDTIGVDVYNKELRYHHFEIKTDDEFNLYIMTEQLFMEINYIEFMINTIDIDNIYIVILRNKDCKHNRDRMIKLCNDYSIERIERCN